MSRSWHQAVTCTLCLLDEGQGVAQVGLERVLGGEDVLAGADLDGAVAAAVRTNRLMDQPVRSSMNLVTARAANTTARWASMESRLRW
jgi:hypothetical protein